MENNLAQLGALGIILLFTIKELFSYLKSRNDGDKSGEEDKTNSLILAELTKMNNNHLHTIQDVLEAGNARLIDAIHNDNTKMIELLGEIKGNLNNRK